jgi:isopentenyl-diphosphate delta-isomerase
MVKMLHVVDEKDIVLDVKTREECHEGEGLLHRATTVLITNTKGEILITRRSGEKPLWPDFWDTSASTHPSENESYIGAARRSLEIELGIQPNIKQIDKFQYKEWYIKDVSSENEMCALFIGEYDGEIIPNPNEVSEFQWMSVENLQRLIDGKKSVSPWLIRSFEKYLEYMRNKI